jgi:glycosyltransferase involved in cell wall biosynthesis
VLVGTGAGDRAIKEQVSRLGLSGRVIFTGQLPQGQVADVLSTADVAVAPYPFLHTDIVGTPLKLLEYMAAGCAIVASTVPLHALIVHGETGLRVPPADPVALAGGISSLLEDRARSRTLGANARREALSRHSWNRAVEEIDLVLRRTIENYA